MAEAVFGIGAELESNTLQLYLVAIKYSFLKYLQCNCI